MNEAIWLELPPVLPPVLPLRSALRMNAEIDRVLSATSPLVLLARPAMDRIRLHTSADTSREHMGVLFGALVEGDGVRLPLILRAEPMQGTVGSATQVSGPEESWIEVWRGYQDDLALMGWYHSHPGLGVFFSETDRATQRRCFTKTWQVGLVMDPSVDEVGVFLGQGATAAAWMCVDAVLT